MASSIIARRTANFIPGELCARKAGQPARPTDRVLVALVGNPNVGKSTLFNLLTGLRQHTGNWPGKTVAVAWGEYRYRNRVYRLIDLPGIYSLESASCEEEVAREFILRCRPDVTVVVLDPGCLARNLGLVLEVIAHTPRTVVCINFLDEAHRKGMSIDLEGLARHLSVEVVGTSAVCGQGIDELKKAIEKVASASAEEPELPRCVPGVASLKGRKFGLASNIPSAREIARQVLRLNRATGGRADSGWLDRLFTSRILCLPTMGGLMGLILWLTLCGANCPCDLLLGTFSLLEPRLADALTLLGVPEPIVEFLITGVYRTMTWVLAVMLPPVTIFFLLWAVLEDGGVLPRVAFHLDCLFRKAGSQGKQALTMGMGLGCNAVGVISCRIMNSPRERLMSMLTNCFIPCNGRFPTLIILAGMFTGGRTVWGLFWLLVIGVAVALAMSFFLSRTLLSGPPSGFALEVPPLRRPYLRHILGRTLRERVIAVVARAVSVAAPAGGIVWVLANTEWAGKSVLLHLAQGLNPVGHWLGMDGFILSAFILGLPANEIVLPTLLMAYMSAGGLVQVDSLADLQGFLFAHGWTPTTALCMALFSLLHYPCATTLITIARESKSCKWALVGFGLPLGVACAVCFLVARAGAIR